MTESAKVSDRRALADVFIESGIEEEAKGDLDSAHRKYDEAVHIAPDYGRAWLNLGIVLSSKSAQSMAVSAFQRAIELEPDSAPAYYNLGLALASIGDLGRAECALALALQHRKTFPDAYAALADVLEAQRRLDAAEDALKCAVAQSPTHCGYLLNLGLIYRKVAKLDEAERTFRVALDFDKTFASAALALAGVLRDKCLHQEACVVLEEILGRDPQNFDVRSNLLFTTLYRDDLGSEEVAKLHRQAGALLEKAVTEVSRKECAISSTRRLKVGYVSGDFRRHAVAFFALPVIEGHDRHNVEVYCYSNTPDDDDMTKRFQEAADQWRDIRLVDDATAAELVRSDDIDILIDLSGHTGGNRLGLFAHRTAPVQATWLGYLSTTGLKRIDYRICDAHTDSGITAQRLHTETLMALPDSQWCYRPYLNVDHVADPPVIRSSIPTFGSFNQFGKISPTIRALWVEILAHVPQAKLFVVGVPDGDTRTRFMADFVANGIASNRLELIDRLDLQAYYEAFNNVDIALDTTPYSGATTTCDALWMGVPVIALAGQRSAARSGASLLTSAGLGSLIAATPDEYVGKAIRLAKDIDRLTQLRRSLRDQMRRSPLMNEPRFVRNLEDLYRTMWADWCLRSA